MTPVKRSTPPIIHSPLPRAPTTFSMSTRSAQPPAAPSIDTVLSEPGVPLFRVPSNVSGTASRSPRSDSRGSDDGELAHSTSSASSFTPAVIGPRSTAGSSDDERSRTGSVHPYDDVVSLPSSASGSRMTSPFFDVRSNASFNQGQPHPQGHAGDPWSDAGSPFTDIHAVSPQLHTTARSPSPSIASQSSLHLRAESDMAILSPGMRSGMFSPSVTASTIDDPFDDISDVSSWASVGRRTPEI